VSSERKDKKEVMKFSHSVIIVALSYGFAITLSEGYNESRKTEILITQF
jgi:hypothetical protein